MEKKYYKVSYQHSESVYCSNIAHAESVEAVEAHYSKYNWCSVSECEEWELESAQRRGMPIIEIDTIQPEETAQEATEADQTAEKLENARQVLESRYGRSAWDKGVTAYALELLDQVMEGVQGGYITADDLSTPAGRRAAMLNGASDWNAYSWGGSALIYNCDIAERLCTPSELKRTRGGERRPNSREEWLDVQARALHQAANRAACAIKEG